MKQRNAWIDLARVLFSIGILLTHLNSLSQPAEEVNLIFCFGFLGVEFFFILSGYLMAVSAQKISGGGHWKRDITIYCP